MTNEIINKVLQGRNIEMVGANTLIDYMEQAIELAISTTQEQALAEYRGKIEVLEQILKDIKSYSPDGEIGTLANQGLSLLSDNKIEE